MTVKHFTSQGYLGTIAYSRLPIGVVVDGIVIEFDTLAFQEYLVDLSAAQLSELWGLVRDFREAFPKFNLQMLPIWNTLLFLEAYKDKYESKRLEHLLHYSEELDIIKPIARVLYNLRVEPAKWTDASRQPYARYQDDEGYPSTRFTEEALPPSDDLDDVDHFSRPEWWYGNDPVMKFVPNLLRPETQKSPKLVEFAKRFIRTTSRRNPIISARYQAERAKKWYTERAQEVLEFLVESGDVQKAQMLVEAIKQSRKASPRTLALKKAYDLE